MKTLCGKTQSGNRYVIATFPECLLCGVDIRPASAKTKEWYCTSCRKNLDDAHTIVLTAGRHSPNNRIAHYLDDPIGYEEMMELSRTTEEIFKSILIRNCRDQKKIKDNRKHRVARACTRIFLRLFHPMRVSTSLWRFAHPIAPAK